MVVVVLVVDVVVVAGALVVVALVDVLVVVMTVRLVVLVVDDVVLVVDWILVVGANEEVVVEEVVVDEAVTEDVVVVDVVVRDVVEVLVTAGTVVVVLVMGHARSILNVRKSSESPAAASRSGSLTLPGRAPRLIPAPSV